MRGKVQQLLVLCGISLYLIVAYMTFFLGPETIKLLTSEDGLFESLTAVYFLLSSFLFLIVYAFSRRKEYSLWNRFKGNIFYLLLAGVFFVGCMEEISWGQRILGLQTPAALSEYNMQRETNIHNLMWFHRSADKEKTHILALMLNVDRLFQLFWLSWCVIIPFADKYNSMARRFFHTVNIPIVSLSVGMLLVLNYVASKIMEGFLPDFTHAIVEVKEQNSAFLLMIVASMELFKFAPVRKTNVMAPCSQ